MSIKISEEVCNRGFCDSCSQEYLASVRKVPKRILSLEIFKPEECIGCANCAVICPDYVIEVER